LTGKPALVLLLQLHGRVDARTTGTVEDMPETVGSILLFIAAAMLEIGGAWLIWQGMGKHRGIVGVGIAALAGYGFVATFQPDPNFGRIHTCYPTLSSPGTRTTVRVR